jgi:hypothetical protein
VIGFTLRKAALTIWLITRHVTGEYAAAVTSMCIQSSGPRQHDELGKACM